MNLSHGVLQKIGNYSFAPGLYQLHTIQKRGWLVKFTDGLLNLMGLNDGLNGQWLGGGEYVGNCPVDFTGSKALHIHRYQISTTENNLNGAPSVFCVLFQLLVTRQTSPYLCVLVTLALCDSSIPS